MYFNSNYLLNFHVVPPNVTAIFTTEITYENEIVVRFLNPDYQKDKFEFKAQRIRKKGLFEL